MRQESSPDDELTREIYIEASPENVFEFFTVQEKVDLWWGSRSEIDPRPGGIYRVEFFGGRVAARGEFIELIPNRRIVHTWGWEGGFSQVPPGESVVEITLRKSGSGTLVILRHSGLKGTADFHAFGWDNYFPRLVAVAKGDDPGEDRLPELIANNFPERLA